VYRGRRVGRAHLQVPGLHNVSNAMAAIGVALQEGVSWQTIASSLARFPGAHRRFQRTTLPDDITLVNDYAHHPTEIKATLAALPKGMARRTIAVFQPHRYSRTKYLAAEYGGCFAAADHVIITDVYAAFETPLAGVSAHQVHEAVVRSGHPRAEYVEHTRLLDHVTALLQPGDCVFFLGAGDIGDLCHAVAQRGARPHLV
jgi:UDP-N-acetylmuramate--alanine ligase